MSTVLVDSDGFPYWDKDPDSTLDYSIDWTNWLAGVSDTITSILWTVPTGISKTSESNTTTRVTIWLSGGTAGTTYTIVCRIITAGGRTDERSFKVQVKER